MNPRYVVVNRRAQFYRRSRNASVAWVDAREAATAFVNIETARATADKLSPHWSGVRVVQWAVQMELPI